MRALARRLRRDTRVPAYRGGPLVGELAFAIVCFAFPYGVPLEAGHVMLEVHDDVAIGDVVEHLTRELEVDEADVLRALAELERVGLFYTGGRGLA